VLYFFDNLTTGHEVIAEFCNFSSFNQSFVDGIYSGLGFVLEVFKDLLYFWPCYLFSKLIPVLQVEYDLFHRQSSIDFGVFYSWLVDELPIGMVVLYLEEEWSHINGLVAESIQGAEDLLQLLPALLIQNASFGDFDRFIVIECGQVWTIDKEDIQELKQSKLVAVLVG
jgi:hypothetical protein